MPMKSGKIALCVNFMCELLTEHVEVQIVLLSPALLR